MSIKLNSSGTLLAIAQCNIHGVWEYAKSIKVEA
jgi:desulfoferrodoxin (superoxide reductase-like protein)